MSMMIGASICLSDQVMSFLDYRDVAVASMVSWRWNAVCGSRKRRKECLRRYGLPKSSRFMFWMGHCQARLMSEAGGALQTYRKSLAKSKFRSENAQASWFTLTQQPGLEGEIARDVTRTFATKHLFSERNGLGQRVLFNVLLALAVYEPKVGYCQGMNFVVAVMIAVGLGLDDLQQDQQAVAKIEQKCTKEIQERLESNVFWLMVAFLNRFDMCELWRPGVPQLKLRIYQFDRLISSKLPSVQTHFRSIGLTPDFFASQWFLTLLSYNLSVKQVVRVWDVLIVDGWKTIFRVGLAVLRKHKRKILEMDLEELTAFFRHQGQGPMDSIPASSGYYSVSDGDLLSEAFQLRVSTRELDDLESDYIAEVLFKHMSHQETRIPTPKSNDLSADAFSEEVFVDHRLADLFRQEIDHLDKDTKNDVQYLRAKIEEAEKLYTKKEQVFRVAAKEYMETKTTLDELKTSKKAVSDQLYEMTKGTVIEEDCVTFLDKIEWIDSRINAVNEQYREALWKTSQAQIDLEEVVEKKNAFSQQLQAVLENNEQSKTATIKQLWEKLQ